MIFKLFYSKSEELPKCPVLQENHLQTLAWVYTQSCQCLRPQLHDSQSDILACQAYTISWRPALAIKNVRSLASITSTLQLQYMPLAERNYTKDLIHSFCVKTGAIAELQGLGNTIKIEYHSRTKRYRRAGWWCSDLIFHTRLKMDWWDTWSYSEFGNWRGILVVSISNAQIRGSARLSRSALCCMLILPSCTSFACFNSASDRESRSWSDVRLPSGHAQKEIDLYGYNMQTLFFSAIGQPKCLRLQWPKKSGLEMRNWFFSIGWPI